MDDASLYDGVKAILVPLLGESMAKATLKVQCDKIKVDAASLGKPSIPGLARGIERSMVVFVGSEKAREVTRKILALGA